MFCRYCGCQNDDNSRSCIKCGRALSQSAEHTMNSRIPQQNNQTPNNRFPQQNSSAPNNMNNGFPRQNNSMPNNMNNGFPQQNQFLSNGNSQPNIGGFPLAVILTVIGAALAIIGCFLPYISVWAFSIKYVSGDGVLLVTTLPLAIILPLIKHHKAAIIPVIAAFCIFAYDFLDMPSGVDFEMGFFVTLIGLIAAIVGNIMAFFNKNEHTKPVTFVLSLVGTIVLVIIGVIIYAANKESRYSNIFSENTVPQTSYTAESVHIYNKSITENI